MSLLKRLNLSRNKIVKFETEKINMSKEFLALQEIDVSFNLI